MDRQGRDEIYVAVAEVDGLPVARVGLSFTNAAEDVAVLWAAHVEPEWQSQGIGTALMAHLEQVARDRGFSIIELLVAKDNDRARALYDRLGYELCGEAVNRWVEQDEHRAETFEEICWRMRKPLDE